MFEGVPTYPDASRFWKIVEKFKVNIFYTAPTAIRALMGLGDSFVEKADLSSLKILGASENPLILKRGNGMKLLAGEKCPVIDTWWQTETGGILIAPIAGTTPLKARFSNSTFLWC